MFREIARTVRERHHRARFRQLIRRVVADPGLPQREPAIVSTLGALWGNGSWSASTDYLTTAMARAVGGTGPILECGSGLSTILVAAVTRGTGRRLISLEHLDMWADRVATELRVAGLSHARVLHAPLTTHSGYDWYDVPEALPTGISLVLCDGPPGATHGGRSGLLPECWGQFDDDVEILLDDAGRAGEQEVIDRWTADYPVSSTVVSTARNPFAVLRRSA